MKKLLILTAGAVVWIALIVSLCLKISHAATPLDEKLSNGAVQYGVSEEASFQAKEGNYSLTIKTVYDVAPDPLTEDPPRAERVAVVVYEYTNTDIKKGLVISDAHFKAFDKQGRELEIYPQKGLFEPGEVGTSGTLTASVAFALNSAENYIEIDFYNDTARTVPDSVYTETWK